MGEEGVREIGAKAAERILPLMAFLKAGPAGALAANIIIISSLLILKLRGSRVKSLEEAEAQDLARLVELTRLIDEKKEEIERLRSQLGAAEGARRRIIEGTLKTQEETLRSLEEEYELTQLRILAIRRLWSLRDKKLEKEVEKLIRDIQEGKVTGKQYEAVKMVEDLWEKRQIEIATLRGILERS